MAPATEHILGDNTQLADFATKLEPDVLSTGGPREGCDLNRDIA
jgi:hypothetical protein